jgi:hypothetical protein
MKQIGSIGIVFLSKVIGFVVFLILLGVTNLMIPYIQNDTFTSVVLFLDSNIKVIVIFTILLMIGELFAVLIFPFNLPAPLFSAIGSVFLVEFIFELIIFINKLTKTPMDIPFNLLYIIVSAIVFIVILIAGYVKIFTDLVGPKIKQIKQPRKKASG